MDDIFQYGWSGFKKFLKENKAALLYTLIFHLVVLIIFLFVKVEGLKNDRELGIELEFEEKTILSSNRAVNLNAEEKLSQDLSTEEYVKDLLDQIEEARDQEDREKLEELQSILASADYVPPSLEEEEERTVYSGPTTITYEFLDKPVNRGKVELTIPVYRCQGSGVVKVEVGVAPDGSVREARVLEPIVGSDRVCFADAALSAAQSSQFRIELSAPAKQRAIITYSFIAQ